jgi:hypothetical protein
MCTHHLFAKRSKCFFSEPSVSYLGHIISAEGVAMDPAKVEAVEAWSWPTTARALHGFLGLTRYYQKFIVGYGGVPSPSQRFSSVRRFPRHRQRKRPS